ncbi:MAG: hypothetical protein JWM62_2194, partial [Frankiales bacterium]|nr:hypothetical protein [Frankiales bacterium]
LAVLLVGRTTGQYGLFRQYAAAGQEANLSLSAGSVPVKLVQLFVDPCYRSFCQGLTDYTPQGLTPDSLLGYWQQPLLMQLPFLLPSVLVLIVSVILLLRHRLVLPLDAVVAAIAAAGLVFGYTANPIAGGAHLKYGFVRDFTAPAALLLYAAARCTVAVLRARAAAPPSDRRGLGWLPLTAGALAVALSLVPGFRLPRLEPVLVDYGLAADTGCSTVARAGCGLRFVGRDASGRQHDLDDRGILLLRCNGRHAGTFASSGALPEGVADAARACSATAGVPLRVAYLPVELGVYQTPEGTSLLDAHVLEVP